MTNSWWLIQNYPWHSRASEDMLCSMCVMDVPRAVRSSTTPRSSIYDDSQTFKANPGFMSRSEIKQCDQSCQMVCDTQKKQSSFTSTEFNVENLFKIRAKRKKTFATNPLPSQPSDTAMKWSGVSRVVSESRGSVWVEDQKWIWPTISTTSIEELFFQQFYINSFSDKYVSWLSEPLLESNLTANLGNPPEACMALESQICASN